MIIHLFQVHSFTPQTLIECLLCAKHWCTQVCYDSQIHQGPGESTHHLEECGGELTPRLKDSHAGSFSHAGDLVEVHGCARPRFVGEKHTKREKSLIRRSLWPRGEAAAHSEITTCQPSPDKSCPGSPVIAVQNSPTGRGDVGKQCGEAHNYGMAMRTQRTKSL